VLKEKTKPVQKSKETGSASRPQSQQSKKTEAKKVGSTQKYTLKNDVTLCSKGCSSGRKIAKTMVLG
jgi:hypothetical protein